MEIRAARSEDQGAVEHVIAAAFGDEGDHVVLMKRALDDSGASRHGLVAADGADIVGYVQLSRAWIDARERLVDALVLTPLAVRPGHQGRRIGRILVERALAVAEESGAPAVMLEGDPRYYGRLGLIAGSSVGLLRPSLRIPDPSFQVVTLSRYESWMTGQAVYPEAVWASDAVGLRDPLLADLEASRG